MTTQFEVRQEMVNRIQDSFGAFDKNDRDQNEQSNPNPGNDVDGLLHQLVETPAIADLFRQMKEATEMAQRFNRDRWDFSIELQQLLDLGTPTHVVRMLVCDGWLEHQREVPSEEGRKFVAASDVSLQNGSCFVLTDKGFSVANTIDLIENKTTNATAKEFNKSPTGPSWDSELREFWVGEQVIKRFRWRAANQERVLEAFAEKGWPSRIDDPLARDEKICPKQRLHDTIKCLNRKHLSEGLVRFKGDGTGKGVLLVFLEPKDEDTNPQPSAT